MAKNNYRIQAYNYIVDAINNGDYKPGALIAENVIAEKLSISRTPVREALKTLEAEGMVISYPGRGSFVAYITRDDIVEICQLRYLMENYALELSINRITDQELDRCEALLKAAEDGLDSETCMRADTTLHNLIIERSGSRYVANLTQQLNSLTSRFRVASSKNSVRWKASTEEHLEILRCIRLRDFEKASAALKVHLENVTEGFCKVLL